MSGMNKILEIHGRFRGILVHFAWIIIVVVEADADVVLQSGVKWEDLNQTLADKGIPLFFPVSYHHL
jgi:FAD/FMN-containing dehydrogenase